MKTYSAAYLQHIAEPVTTLAICWRVVKKNGDLILGTTHDRSIVIAQTNVGIDTGSPPAIDLIGVYRADSGITASTLKTSSDMSVDNMAVDGALQAEPDLFVDVAVQDIRAGLLDGARLTTFRVNWQNPDDFQDVLRHGHLGQIDWNSDGSYTTEVRGLTQILQQSIGRNCGETCDVAEFGDARCGLDVEALAVPGMVTAVTNRRRFDSTLSIGSPAPSAGYFDLGKLVWLSGANAGLLAQVKSDSQSATLGNILLWDEAAYDIQPGDTFDVRPGCDRRYATCRDVHNNLVNFRGPGIFTPGHDEILRAPQ